MAAALQPSDRRRSWADLPLDLAAAVLCRLPPHPLDRVRFGAVCPEWRTAARENPAMPPHFPWLVLPNWTFYSLPDTAFRLLPAHLDGHRQLPHAQTSCGELLVFERHDGAITLMSPFSGTATMVLPGLRTLHPRRDDEEALKIAATTRNFTASAVQGPEIRKLVVCSDNLVAAAVIEAGDPKVKLALCRPGAASWSWAVVDGTNVVVRDLVLYQRQLYAFFPGRSLWAVSITTVDGGEPAVSSVDRVIAGLLGPPPYRRCYLLESRGALLMVTQKKDEYPVPVMSGGGVDPPAAMCVVYVASFERSEWTEARDDSQLLAEVTDGRVLFLGPWCSRSVAVGRPDQRGFVGENSIVVFSERNRILNRFGCCLGKRLTFFCSVYDIKTRRSQSPAGAGLYSERVRDDLMAVPSQSDSDMNSTVVP